ncbi:alkene reductase [Leptobacterium flavescens]|uniref:Alkene reductase n=2 Tax=Leptobacterium flavescens TaxID=472055 RepID=A0A6P0UNI9_9FLAO|nr:alkene reductase [Leptobacterium flavescens]
MKLFSTHKLGNIELKNRIVMAPMTRARANGNIPNDMMATYYAKRADAGLIITEGTAPSPNGLGYARIPGIYSQSQINGWKKITKTVHNNGGKIFMQIMHTGRVSHPLNMEEGARILAPSAIALSGEMYTDQEGLKPYPTPEAMSIEEIKQAQAEFVEAARNAIEAGFDGVEIHAANGYLANQFLNPASNQRNDIYGGSAENRNRFVIELAEQVANAIGADKTGVRLSPYGVFNDMEIYEGIDEAFISLARELDKLKLVYLHLVDLSAQGAPEVPQSIKDSIRSAFKGNVIINGGLNKDTAEATLNEEKGELVAFGVPFISNPDLVYKIENDLELNAPDPDTFFTPGIEGYLDYPTLN